MSPNSNHKTKLLLGICGGIAAYKCADLVRRLVERDFDVRVVMTDAAAEFITPMTLQAVSGNPVNQAAFDPDMEAAMGHIELARWADAILIAPATANTLAKLAHGKADNLLTTIVLASSAPLFIAPAMNQQMWSNPQTQANMQQLEHNGHHILGPGEGAQACGDIGLGRMLEPLDIAQRLATIYAAKGSLAGKSVLLTAGPTVEAIDPVRFISNHSSGKMGYALAKAAAAAGAKVCLVSGPVNLAIPANVNVIKVTSAMEMLQAVQDNLLGTDVFIGCAAVADYSPVEVCTQKIKKNEDEMILKLKRNPDILAWVSNTENRPFVVGFAAESQNLKTFALGKLNNKKLDMICANNISNTDVGFNSDNNELLLLFKGEEEKRLTIAAKEVLAHSIVDEISKRISN
ncbi:bifunctional phosphopantothenoylcysteine decarboxylase/phosphopantothenate--cysteine ligase CoaBC [Aliikangiella sp. IMCC44653]